VDKLCEKKQIDFADRGLEMMCIVTWHQEPTEDVACQRGHDALDRGGQYRDRVIVTG
jgi:hypothetical protein